MKKFFGRANRRVIVIIKHRITAVALIFVLFISGCNRQGNRSFKTLVNDETNDYFIKSDIFKSDKNQSEITVQYPKFNSNTKSLDGINDIVYASIQNFLEKSYSNDYNGLTVDLDYDLKFINNHYASIVFSGYSNIQTAAHPTNICFTVNIRMNKPAKFTLCDFVETDDTFIQKFRKSYKQQLAGEAAEYIDKYTDKELKGYFNSGDVYGYFTKDAIGIIFTLPHAIGDFAVIEIA